MNRHIGIILTIAMVGLCFAYHFNRTELPAWWRASGGGVPYVMFWVTFWFAMIPKAKLLTRIAIGCTLFTCLLEALQLWQPDWLTRIRETFLGAALLGKQFVWADIPPYFMGGLAGWVLVRVAVTLFSSPRQQPDMEQ